MVTYDKNFYAGYQEVSARSGYKVLSMVLDIVKPRSIVDVGCGIGTWLAQARTLGVPTTLGLDGDYVDRNQLLIPEETFLPADLKQKPNIPARFFPNGQRFDLAMSVEVAEHLPAASATAFVQTLTSLSDVVLFSAAIPHQGGNEHINEQWPAYWAQKFADEGYVLLDIVRPKFWKDADVAYYYAQNGFLYVKQQRLEDFPALVEHALPVDHWSLACVHPERWLQAHNPKRVSLRLVLQAAPHAVLQATKRRVYRLLGRGQA